MISFLSFFFDIQGYLILLPIFLLIWLVVPRQREALRKTLAAINLSVAILGLLGLANLFFNNFEFAMDQLKAMHLPLLFSILIFMMVPMKAVLLMALLYRPFREDLRFSIGLWILMVLQIIVPVLLAFFLVGSPPFIPLVVPVYSLIIVLVVAVVLYSINRFIIAHKES